MRESGIDHRLALANATFNFALHYAGVRHSTKWLEKARYVTLTSTNITLWLGLVISLP